MNCATAMLQRTASKSFSAGENLTPKPGALGDALLFCMAQRLQKQGEAVTSTSFASKKQQQTAFFSRIFGLPIDSTGLSFNPTKGPRAAD